MLARTMKHCLKSFLKIVNLVFALAGVSMILYGIWMIRVWQRDISDEPSPINSIPWFIYTLFGIGVSLCLITCIGHLAADTANGFCLSFYTVIIFLLILSEIAVTADVFLNSDWKEDLPEDPTGFFEDFRHFIKSNVDIFKSLAFTMLLAQVFAILLAMLLRNLRSNQPQNYDSDDDYVQSRVPLMNSHPAYPPNPYIVPDSHFPPNNDAWKIKIPENALLK